MKLADGFIVIDPRVYTALHITSQSLAAKVKSLMDRCESCGPLQEACDSCALVVQEFQTLLTHIQSMAPGGITLRKELGN